MSALIRAWTVGLLSDVGLCKALVKHISLPRPLFKKRREGFFMSKKKYTFVDLFAGAGGLSEGFVRAGFDAIAHIEMDHYACDTLRTRASFHYLQDEGQLDVYENYLRNKKEKEDGSKLWNQVPKSVIDTVINATIGEDTIQIFLIRSIN